MKKAEVSLKDVSQDSKNVLLSFSHKFFGSSLLLAKSCILYTRASVTTLLNNYFRSINFSWS